MELLKLPNDIIYQLQATYSCAWPLMGVCKKYYFLYRDRSNRVSLAEILNLMSNIPLEQWGKYGFVIHTPLNVNVKNRTYVGFSSCGLLLSIINLNNDEIKNNQFTFPYNSQKVAIIIIRIRDLINNIPDFWVDPILYYRILSKRRLCLHLDPNYHLDRTEFYIKLSIRYLTEWVESHPNIINNSLEYRQYVTSILKSLELEVPTQNIEENVNYLLRHLRGCLINLN